MASKSIGYAYKLLSIRDYFKKELYNKIESKFGSLEAEIAVIEMEKQGFINDERVAYNYIRQKLTAGYGPYYISSKLYFKGCEKDISFIYNVIDKENIDIKAVIEKYSKRYIKKNSDDPYKDFIKCCNFLKNKGFSQSEIFEVIKKEDFEI